jgi:outer membrane protein
MKRMFSLGINRFVNKCFIKKGSYKLVALTLSLLIVSSNTYALDLVEAVQRAKRYDATFLAAYANYVAVSESSSQSLAAALPQVAINAFVQRGKTENDRAGVITKFDDNNDGYSLSLNQVVFNKTIFENIGQGNAIAAQALADFEVAKQDMVIGVAQAYFAVLTAKDALETVEAEIKAIGEQLEQSKERYNVGLSNITDVKEQQASYDIAQADKIIAENELANAREVLSVIINLYSTNVEVVREKIPLVVPEPMDINAWQKKALENNFGLRSSQYAVDAARSAYDGSKGGHYPTLNLNASYGITNTDARNSLVTGTTIPENESESATVRLSLDIPLYSGGQTSSLIRQRASELNQAIAIHELTQRTTKALARSAYQSLAADISTVKAREQAVISTQTSLDATIAGYDAGTRTSVDVLLARRLLYSSKRDYFAARYKYIMDSLELKRAAGILTENDLVEINNWLEPGK